jgi:hypothetical protein
VYISVEKIIFRGINTTVLEHVLSFTRHLHNLLCVRIITCEHFVEVKQICSLPKGPGGGKQPDEKRVFHFSKHHQ